MTTLHDALERRVSATRAASSLQGVLQRHVETLRWALLESHRASGLLDLNVTEANLREEPADVAGPYVSGTRRRYRPAWRALNVCKSGLAARDCEGCAAPLAQLTPRTQHPPFPVSKFG